MGNSFLERLGLVSSKRKASSEKKPSNEHTGEVEKNIAKKSHEVRERLMDISEELFAHYGFEGVSLRQLTDASNIKMASIIYYFKSKEGLYLQTIQRVFSQVDMIRSSKLIEVDENPSLENYLRAYISAPFIFYAQHDPSHYRARLMWRLSCEEPSLAERTSKMFVSETTQVYMQRIHKYYPHLTADDFHELIKLLRNFINATLAKSVGETYDVKMLRSNDDYSEVIERIMQSAIVILGSK